MEIRENALRDYNDETLNLMTQGNFSALDSSVFGNERKAMAYMYGQHLAPSSEDSQLDPRKLRPNYRFDELALDPDEAYERRNYIRQKLPHHVRGVPTELQTVEGQARLVQKFARAICWTEDVFDAPAIETNESTGVVKKYQASKDWEHMVAGTATADEIEEVCWEIVVSLLLPTVLKYMLINLMIRRLSSTYMPTVFEST